MNPVAALSAGYGLQASLRAFDRAATAVGASAALVSNESIEPSTDSTDLVDSMTGMDMAAESFSANVTVLRTADEMLGTLLDLRG
jgi:flagellar hook protein FlgE